jgi:hypothetical protein
MPAWIPLRYNIRDEMDAEVLSMSEAEISVANAEGNREPAPAQTFEHSPPSSALGLEIARSKVGREGEGEEGRLSITQQKRRIEGSGTGI